MGEVQALQAACWLESMRHSKEVTPEPLPSLPEKVKSALAEALRTGGLESIVVVGAVVSIVQLKAAAAPALPALSTALTSKLCEPSASAE